MALGSAGSPNGSQPILLSASHQHRKPDLQAIDKEDIRGFMVIATTAAAVTFVMGFTCTKLYISSAPDLGLTGLVKKAVFMVFLFCNSMPMLASVVAVLNFIWAKHLTDFPLIDKAFLLGVALASCYNCFCVYVGCIYGWSLSSTDPSSMEYLFQIGLALDSVFL